MDPEHTQFLIIDEQEKFAPAIDSFSRVTERTALLAKACALLSVPVLVTEQYPKGLGPTVSAVAEALPEGTKKFEKRAFSCLEDDACRSALLDPVRSTLLIAGVESHVCILQTALDAVRKGLTVYVVSDAVSSRHPADRDNALSYLQAHGVHVLGTEAVIFLLLKTSAHPQFRSVQKLLI